MAVVLTLVGGIVTYFGANLLLGDKHPKMGLVLAWQLIALFVTCSFYVMVLAMNGPVLAP
jgi:hypothetical protein